MQSVNPADIDSQPPSNPYEPPKDRVFDTLFGLAIQGDLRVYFAAVPLSLIRPHSPHFRFLETPNANAIVEALIDAARKGQFPRLWVYEKDDYFVMSDDYPQYEACLQGQPDYVPCWILGRPRNPAAIDVQGPVNAREAAGLDG